MLNEYRLTTFDNPFDPFEEFTSWYKFDVAKGYNTCDYLGRVVKTFEGMTTIEENLVVEEAIDEIILKNPLNIYKKVARNKTQTADEQQ